MNGWKGFELVLGWMVQMLLVVCVLNLQGCEPAYVEGGGEATLTQPVVACTVSMARYPTTESDFARLYAGRAFLADGVHIGRDVNLAEGTAIYPIACGTVRVYRAAQGYGTLVVVIEHHLPMPITVQNGLGEMVRVQDFLTIYGHLRRTSARSGGTTLPWREGDTVRPDQIIGYVQNGADNGDGAEHLHFGVRLQTMEGAVRADPRAWFAGYDPEAVRRRWYADPLPFMSAVLRRPMIMSMATWHPPGTVLNVAGQMWYVATDGFITRLSDELVSEERFAPRIVQGVPAEVACMATVGFSLERTSTHRLVRFDGVSTVYEYSDTPSPVRYTFLAQEAFDSWGWTASRVEMRPASERMAFLERYRDIGSRRLRDGALVKAHDRSDVYVVSQGQRRPIFDWPTFLALGYDEHWIIEVDSSVLDLLAGPLGAVIRPEDVRRCGMSGGSMPPPREMDAGMDVAGVPSLDASIGPDVFVEPPDVRRTSDAPLPMMDAGVTMDSGARDAEADVITPDVVVSDALVMDAARAMDAPVSIPDVAPVPPSDGSCTDLLRDAGTGSVFDVVRDRDAAVSDVVDTPPAGAVMRYEFRLATDTDDWRPTEPYYLRDRYWTPQRCLNASGADATRMVGQGDGWYRCDTADILSIFVGTFFSPSHLTSGDRGNIATVDNWPMPCTPRMGVEWRISELPAGRQIYRGIVSGLSCASVSGQSRHQLP